MNPTSNLQYTVYTAVHVQSQPIKPLSPLGHAKIVALRRCGDYPMWRTFWNGLSGFACTVYRKYIERDKADTHHIQKQVCTYSQPETKRFFAPALERKRERERERDSKKNSRRLFRIWILVSVAYIAEEGKKLGMEAEKERKICGTTDASRNRDRITIFPTHTQQQWMDPRLKQRQPNQKNSGKKAARLGKKGGFFLSLSSWGKRPFFFFEIFAGDYFFFPGKMNEAAALKKGVRWDHWSAFYPPVVVVVRRKSRLSPLIDNDTRKPFNFQVDLLTEIARLSFSFQSK